MVLSNAYPQHRDREEHATSRGGRMVRLSSTATPRMIGGSPSAIAARTAPASATAMPTPVPNAGTVKRSANETDEEHRDPRGGALRLGRVVVPERAADGVTERQHPHRGDRERRIQEEDHAGHAHLVQRVAGDRVRLVLPNELLVEAWSNPTTSRRNSSVRTTASARHEEVSRLRPREPAEQIRYRVEGPSGVDQPSLELHLGPPLRRRKGTGQLVSTSVATVS